MSRATACACRGRTPTGSAASWPASWGTRTICKPTRPAGRCSANRRAESGGGEENAKTPRREEDKETGRQGDRETGRQGDRETGRQGDRETGRQGDRETG